MNSNNKFNFYKSAIYFLIANAVLFVAGIVIFAVFGFNYDTTLAGSKLFFSAVIMTVLSTLVLYIYIGLRYDWAKALTSALAVVHNVLLSTALVAIIRIPLSEALIAGYALTIGLTAIFIVVLTDKIKEINHKKADYSEVIKNAISKSIKQIVVLSVVIVAILFLSLIIASKDVYSFARLAFVMIVVVLYSAIALIMPIWLYFSSKMKNIKRAKIDENVENQKVAKAVQTEQTTEENE